MTKSEYIHSERLLFEGDRVCNAGTPLFGTDQA